MANKLQILTTTFAVLLCSCSGERAVPTGHQDTTAQKDMNTFLVNTTAFNEMVGKQVRLAGALVNAGKGNYTLQTTNGLVALDGYFEIKETNNTSNVVVEGTLEFQKAVTIPKNFDPLSVQTTARPGQEIPEHYVLRQAKIVKIN